MQILKNASPIHTAHLIRPFFLSEYKRKSGLACETIHHQWLYNILYYFITKAFMCYTHANIPTVTTHNATILSSNPLAIY